MESQLNARAIIGRTLAMLGQNNGVALFALVALTANTVVQDFLPGWQFAYIIVSIAVSLAIQYWVMRSVIARAGMMLADRNGLGTSFCGTAIGTSLLSGLALLLVIVPGVYLFLRWSIALPLVLAEGEKTDGAMSGSTEQTRGHLVQIGLAQLVMNLPWFAGVAMGAWVYRDEVAISLPLSLLSAALAAGGFVASWFCMVATYEQLRPNHGLEEVFA